jgi:membrane glycosyltransferase
MLSIPMSVYSSRISLGRWLRRAGLFVIPEEVSPPAELRRMQNHLQRAAPLPGFVEAVVDPLVHALACASANMRRSQPAASRESRQRLIEEAVAGGPQLLSNAQKATLLGDPLAFSRLHFLVWASPQAHPSWFQDMPAVVAVPAAEPAPEPVAASAPAPVPVAVRAPDAMAAAAG